MRTAARAERVQREARRKPAIDPTKLLTQLERHGGHGNRPPPKRALDWLLWENAAFLVPDERREAAYRALESRTGLSAAGILALSREEFFELAELEGMPPDRRVAKLIAIAETVNDEFDGDLESALRLPLTKARRALERFPGIGDPGADKILLFTRTHPLPALDSNGLRVLVRLGVVAEARARPVAPAGQALCKHNAPLREECSIVGSCPSAT